VDREHGQQFKADELKTAHPASAEGIEKYLAAEGIRSGGGIWLGGTGRCGGG
jgi:exodeoxyribonuclease V alpha subunit